MPTLSHKTAMQVVITCSASYNGGKVGIITTRGFHWTRMNDPIQNTWRYQHYPDQPDDENNIHGIHRWKYILHQKAENSHDSLLKSEMKGFPCISP